jgi:hypothetical protein
VVDASSVGEQVPPENGRFEPLYEREREPSLICVFVGRASTLLYNGTYIFAATIWLINIARLGTDKNLGPTK